MTKPSVCFWFAVPLMIAACGSTDDAGDGDPDVVAGRSGVSTSGASMGGAAAGSFAGSMSSAGKAAAGAPGSAGAATSAGGTSNSGGGQSATGGGSGGVVGVAGKPGAGGAAAGGAPGSAGSTSTTYGPSPSCKAWPAATGSTQKLSATKKVSGSFDGKLQRYIGEGDLGGSGQEEGQDPLFELADGATLSNVIIGAPAADGIHCKGSCTLKNVWWEDVGEDAATFLGTSASQVMSIDCGGAKNASDKVLQHNGPGTMKVSNFYVSTFGKLYRSCGNCGSQYARHVEFSGISATGGKSIAGVNENYKDTATFSNLLVSSGMVICQKYKGNDTGAEPATTSAGADGKVCIYQASDIHTK